MRSQHPAISEVQRARRSTTFLINAFSFETGTFSVVHRRQFVHAHILHAFGALFFELKFT